MQIKYFATTNKNKISEANAILGYNLEQISLDLLETQNIDVEAVVREKAKDAFLKTGKIILVEDTSLEFLAWNNLPGALIKWFSDSVGNDGILKMLGGEKNRKAIAKSAVGFFDGEKAHVFIGSVSGTISETARGENNFGWDPIFIPDGYDKTFAEMTTDEKNSLSMRKMALEGVKNNLN